MLAKPAPTAWEPGQDELGFPDILGAGLSKFWQAGELVGEPAPTGNVQDFVGAGFSISKPAEEMLAKPALTASKPAPTACNEESKIIPLLANHEIVNLP